MRGRKPLPVVLVPTDRPLLEAVARGRRFAWFQVQHARIELAVAAGDRVQDVAARVQCARATVWRACRRYERGGLTKLLQDDTRAGRPQEVSPPSAGSTRRAGLSAD